MQARGPGITNILRTPCKLKHTSAPVLAEPGGQSNLATDRSTGVVERTPINCLKAEQRGKLKGAGSEVTGAGQVEINRRAGRAGAVEDERYILISRSRGLPKLRQSHTHSVGCVSRRLAVPVAGAKAVTAIAFRMRCCSRT